MRQVVLEVTSSMLRIGWPLLFQVLPCPPGHRITVRTPPLHEPHYTTVSANNLENIGGAATICLCHRSSYAPVS